MRTSFFSAVLISLAISAPVLANSSSTILCTDSVHKLVLQLEGEELALAQITGQLEYAVSHPAPLAVSTDAAKDYSFLVADWNDTQTWFDLTIKDQTVTKRAIYESGNDSDNHEGSKVAEGDAAFTCQLIL